MKQIVRCQNEAAIGSRAGTLEIDLERLNRTGHELRTQTGRRFLVLSRCSKDLSPRVSVACEAVLWY